MDKNQRLHSENIQFFIIKENTLIQDKLIREPIMKKEVQLKYVKLHDQVVDTFTKPLQFEDFRKLRILLGITNIQF